tara:strand:+ start:1076 stop:1456 length:381 start_codon:yes stop_codon:yes gene_type:complete
MVDRKLLIFNEQATTADIGDAAHDVYATTPSRFLGATNDGTGGVDLVLYFEGSAEGMADGDASSIDKVTLTINDNKHVSVLKELAQVLHATGPGYSDGAIVMFDAENSISFSNDVTGIAISVATQD